jgi:hypothetical protein
MEIIARVRIEDLIDKSPSPHQDMQASRGHPSHWITIHIRPMPHESQWKLHKFLQHGTLLLKSLLFLVFLLKLWNSRH